MMLRVAVILTPILLISAISCSDSSSSDSSNTTTNNTGGDTSSGGAADTNQGGGETTTTAGKTSGGSTSQGGTSSQSPGGASSNPNGGAPSEPAGGAPSEPAGGAGSQAAAGAGGAGAAACPDLFGAYAIKTTAGMCGDINKGAPQAIDGNDVTCAAHFVSNPAKGKAGINGGATLTAKGSFTGAKLTLGTVPRTGCTGTYNALAQTMTVKCGAAADLCTVVLTKQ